MQNEKLRSQIAMLPTRGLSDLSKREKAVYRYVSSKPGVSKQNVIDKLSKDNEGSRVTILNAIDNLERYSIVEVEKDKPNSQIYKLYINEDSILASALRQIDNFEREFFSLLEQIGKKDLKQEYDKESYSVFMSRLIDVYRHVLDTYITYSIMVWPRHIKNKKTLNRLFTILLYRMVGIREKISEVFDTGIFELPELGEPYTMGDLSNRVSKSFISSTYSYGLFSVIEKMLEDGKKYGLLEEIKSMIGAYYEICYKINPLILWNMGGMGEYGTLVHPKEKRRLDFYKNWENVLSLWKNRNESLRRKYKGIEKLDELMGDSSNSPPS